MFARFRNFFTKNKEVEEKTDASFGNSDNYAKTSANAKGISEASSKLEGLNLLKSIAEREPKGPSNVTKASAPTSLSEEVAELFKKKHLPAGGEVKSFREATENETENADKSLVSASTDKELQTTSKIVPEAAERQNDSLELSEEESYQISNKEEIEEKAKETVAFQKGSNENTVTLKLITIEEEKVTNEISSKTSDLEPNILENVKETNGIDVISDKKETAEQEVLTETFFSQNEVLDTEILKANSESNEVISTENKENSSSKTENKLTLKKFNSDLNEHIENNHQTNKIDLENSPVKFESQELNDNLPNTETNSSRSRENSPEISESSKSLSQSSVKEIAPTYSTTQSLSHDFDTNLCNNNFSIVVEDIPSEITTPSPTVDSTISGSSSNTSTLDSSAVVNEILDPSKIIVNPIDNNGLACNAITNKLTDIAEVAESLDAVIREVQENVQVVEVESNPSPSDKKLGTPRSTSSEDWHSRSTEDDSFATASEGNFTPHSHSSASFQTASGRTSSYISCGKNSFDASEADDSTYAFEMPELTSPLNMSFEGSEQSYLLAQPPNNDLTSRGKEKTPTKLSESGSPNTNPLEEDQSSVADVEELHSESVTPTPEQHYDGYHVDSIPIESETELEVAGISNAPSMRVLTEHTVMPLSKTPEVSPSTSNVCSNQNPITTQMTVNVASDSNDQQEQENTNNNSNNNNNNKPNAAWRRSKYYENITKQTIKGFL